MSSTSSIISTQQVEAVDDVVSPVDKVDKMKV